MLVFEASVQGGTVSVTGSVNVTVPSAAIPEKLSAPTAVPNWGNVAEGLRLADPSASIGFESQSFLGQNTSASVELLAHIDPGPVASKVLDWGSGAMILTVDQASAYGFNASVGNLSVPLPADAPDNPTLATAPLAGRIVSIGIVRTDHELLLVIDGTVVARHVSQGRLARLGAVGQMRIACASGSLTFLGLRVSTDVPDYFVPVVVKAQQEGVGEVGSRWLVERSSLGAPMGSVDTTAGGRQQRCANGLIVWSPNKLQTFVLRDAAIIDRWLGPVGGPNSSVGFPTQDEADSDGTSQTPRVPEATPYRVAAFEGGAIYRPQGGPTFLMSAFATAAYWGHGGADGGVGLGLPKTDEVGLTAATRIQFEGGSLYWPSDESRLPIPVVGTMDRAYDDRGGPDGWMGLPVSAGRPFNSQVAQLFDNAMLFSANTGLFALGHDFANAYQTKWLTDGSPPLGDPIGEVVPEVQLMTATPPGAYCEFEHGIIAMVPTVDSSGNATHDLMKFTTIELRLGSTTARFIDDGLDVFEPDHDAELYTFVSVSVNGTSRDVGRRDPAAGHGGKTITMDDRPYTIDVVRHDSSIVLDIDVWDWDQDSADDPLGHHHRVFDISNGWGASGPNLGAHIDEEISSPYEDAYYNSKNILFNYTIAAPSQPDDPNEAWRSQHWWAFGPVKTDPLTYDQFSRTFDDVAAGGPNWLLHQFDAIAFYALYQHIAKRGACFGMSALAEKALRHPGILRQPLTQYAQNAGFTDLINIWHGAQLDPRILSAGLAQIVNPVYHPSSVIDAAQEYTNLGLPLMIGARTWTFDSNGHVVLAYQSRPGPPDAVWVGNPNEPYSAATGADTTDVHLTSSGFSFYSANDSTYLDRFSDHLLLSFTPEKYDPPWHTPMWEFGWGFLDGLASLITFSGGGTLEALAIDDYVLGGTINGPLEQWAQANGIQSPRYQRERPPPGFAILPLFDASETAVLAATRGYVPDQLHFQVRGTSADPYDIYVRTATGGLRLSTTPSDAHHEEFVLSGLRAGRPALRIASEKAKTIEFMVGALDPAQPPLTNVRFDLTPNVPASIVQPRFAPGVDISFDGPSSGAEIAFGNALSSMRKVSLPAPPSGALTRVEAVSLVTGQHLVSRYALGQPRILSAQMVVTS